MSPSDGPSTPASAVVRILAVPRQEGLCVLFCGPYLGLITHHQQSRSWACPGPEKCPPAVHRVRSVWKGYAPVRAWNPRQDHWYAGVLEITEALEELLRGRNLAGEVWMLQRDNDRKRSGPVTGFLVEKRQPGPLCLPFDVRPPLYRMYHTLELDLGVPNPLPAKLILPVAGGQPPLMPQVDPQPDLAPPTAEQWDALRNLTGGRRIGRPSPNGKR